MAKMDPIEKLAREICWAGFTTKEGRFGKTKAGYWKSLPSHSRDSYYGEAKQFAWLLNRISVEVLNELHRVD